MLTPSPWTSLSIGHRDGWTKERAKARVQQENSKCHACSLFELKPGFWPCWISDAHSGDQPTNLPGFFGVFMANKPI